MSHPNKGCFFEFFIKSLEYVVFCDSVYSTKAIVEKNKFRFGGQGTGESQSLLLTSTEIDSPLSDAVRTRLEQADLRRIRSTPNRKTCAPAKTMGRPHDDARARCGQLARETFEAFAVDGRESALAVARAPGAGRTMTAGRRGRAHDWAARVSG